MDKEIEYYVEDFIQEGEKRGFYLRFYLMERIDYMLFEETGEDIIGLVGEDKRGFYISPSVRETPIKLRLTVYHEIGHILKNSIYHSCDYCYDIMSSMAPLDLNPLTKEVFWQEQLDEYFVWLNTI